MFAAVAQIKSEAAYRAAMKRIDELLPLTGDDVPPMTPICWRWICSAIW